MIIQQSSSLVCLLTSVTVKEAHCSPVCWFATIASSCREKRDTRGKTKGRASDGRENERKVGCRERIN
jgi:hypothetical protein